ncbi:unnamed protein product [Closterium sp. NIES-54]
MALCPSSIPQCVALPSPPASSVPNIPDPESDLARAASSSVTRLLSTVVTDPEFESTPAFSLVTELVNFAARSCLDYVLQRFGFQYSLPQPTPLPTGHSLSAPPSDESVEPSGPYPELVGCLMYLMTCTRPDLAYPLSLLARYVAPGQGSVVLTGHSDASWADDQAIQRSSRGYNFSLGSGSVSWRSTRSSSVLGSRCEADIYTGAMAAQELRWLTYLVTDLEERPRSPPVLYVDNKAILALCHEQRLEHRMKHIALRYFLS